MTDADLKSRERALEREQTEWKQKLVDIERDFLKKRAEIDALEPRTKFLKQSVEELKAELVRAEDYLKQAKAEAASIQSDVAAARTTLTSLINRQSDAQKAWEAQQEAITRKVDELKEQAEVDMANDLAPLKKEQHDLFVQIESGRSLLDSLAEQAVEATLATIALQEQLASTQKATDAEAKELTNAVKIATAEHAKILADNKELLNTQSLILDENSGLKKQNAEFVTYEKIARQALQTADEALQERERIVAEREQYRPPAKSFLPPTDA